MRYVKIVLFVLAGLLVATPVSADVGFGIPDMIREKVEELDQEVRDAEDELFFPALQPFTIIAGDSSVIITDVAISRDARKIYVLTDDNDDASVPVNISLVNGSGDVVSNASLGGFVPEHLAIKSTGEPVVLTRNDSTSSQVTILDENLGGFTGVPDAILGDTQSTLALDGVDNIYTAGIDAVRKFDSAGDSVWRDTGYRVPEDNLIVQGNSVFFTTLYETPATNSASLSLYALDQDDGSVEWSETLVDRTATSTISGTSYLTIGSDRLHVLFQETLAGGGQGDTMFVHNLTSGNDIDTVIYQTPPSSLPSNVDPIPTLVDAGGNIYAGDRGGTVYKLNSDGSFNSKLSLSDSTAIPWIVDDGDSVYFSAREDTRGIVRAVGKGFTAADSQTVFVSTSDTLPVNTRPVWLADGFLGVVFSGGRLTVNQTPLVGDELEASSLWPHRHGDNQQTRRRD